MAMSRAPLVALLAGALLFSAAGCGGQVEPTATPARTPTPGPTATSVSPAAAATATPATGSITAVRYEEFDLAPPGSTFVHKLLARIPNRESSWIEVSLNNFAAIREFTGVARPGPDTDTAAVIEAMTQTYTGPLYWEGPQVTGDRPRLAAMSSGIGEEPYRYLGFDWRNVDSGAAIQWSDGASEIVLGLYDPEHTAAAFDRCENCVPHEIKTHSGVDYYSWPGEITDRRSPPLYGEGYIIRRLLVGDGVVVGAFDDQVMEAYIDTAQDAHPSLMDDEDFALLARGLGGLDAVSAFVTDASFDYDDVAADNIGNRSGGSDKPMVLVTEELFEEIATSGPLLRPFRLLASGSGHDGTMNYTALAIVHDDAEAAAENVERLVGRVQHARRLNADPWADRIEAIDVGAVGRLLLARLYQRGEPGSPIHPSGAQMLFISE